MTTTAQQIAEGIAAGLIKVEFTAPTSPREYTLTITNGSGIKAATITSSRASSAAQWGARWAASVGAGWQLRSVDDAETPVYCWTCDRETTSLTHKPSCPSHRTDVETTI